METLVEQAEKSPVTMSIGLRVRWNRHPARRITGIRRSEATDPNRVGGRLSFERLDILKDISSRGQGVVGVGGHPSDRPDGIHVDLPCTWRAATDACKPLIMEPISDIKELLIYRYRTRWHSCGHAMVELACSLRVGSADEWGA